MAHGLGKGVSVRASWRRDLDRVDTAQRASNHMCPICENHVWTHAPGKSYVVYNHENYHIDCLKAEIGQTALDDLTDSTADRNYSGSDTSKITASEVTK